MPTIDNLNIDIEELLNENEVSSANTSFNGQGKELFQKQKEYIEQHKEALFGRYRNAKIGFGLNVSIHFSYLLQFELLKVFSELHEEVQTERFICEMIPDILDATWTMEGDDFSLIESMKVEAKLSLVSRYIRSIRNKKVYPSQVKRKEKSLLNALKRAESIIEESFSERDIRFQEISDIIDIFETIVMDNGKTIDFHFGNNGFTLEPHRSTQQILAYVQKERIEVYEKQLLWKQEMEGIKTYFHEFKKLGLADADLLEKFPIIHKFDYSSYDLKNTTKEDLKEKSIVIKEGLKHLHSFLVDLKEYQGSIEIKNARFDILHNTITKKQFSFNYKNHSAETFVQAITDFEKVTPFIQTFEKELGKNELLVNIIAKDSNLEFNISKNFKRLFAETLDLLPKQWNRPIRFHLQIENGRVYRESGEEVLTAEALVYEVMEKVRNSQKDYIDSIERAKEMLRSVLSAEEEKILLEEDITIVEGDKNYYALLTAQTYNNVVKIPKVITCENDIKALCIHPEEFSVPKYDGFATIALSVKSGDEDYVLDNSNEFSLAKDLKAKVLSVLQTFINQKTAVAVA